MCDGKNILRRCRGMLAVVGGGVVFLLVSFAIGTGAVIVVSITVLSAAATALMVRKSTSRNLEADHHDKAPKEPTTDSVPCSGRMVENGTRYGIDRLLVMCERMELPQDAVHLACAYKRRAGRTGLPHSKVDTVVMKLAMKWLYDTGGTEWRIDSFGSVEEYRMAEAAVLAAFSYRLRICTRYDRVLEHCFGGRQFLGEVSEYEFLWRVKASVLETERETDDDDTAVGNVVAAHTPREDTACYPVATPPRCRRRDCDAHGSCTSATRVALLPSPPTISV